MTDPKRDRWLPIETAPPLPPAPELGEREGLVPISCYECSEPMGMGDPARLYRHNGGDADERMCRERVEHASEVERMQEAIDELRGELADTGKRVSDEREEIAFMMPLGSTGPLACQVRNALQSLRSDINAITDERNTLTRDLAAARGELDARRSHAALLLAADAIQERKHAIAGLSLSTHEDDDAGRVHWATLGGQLQHVEDKLRAEAARKFPATETVTPAAPAVERPRAVWRKWKDQLYSGEPVWTLTGRDTFERGTVYCGGGKGGNDWFVHDGKCGKRSGLLVQAMSDAEAMRPEWANAERPKELRS